MNSARHWIEVSFLQSKVARRIFLLFILCALLPLCALALFSYVQVRDHLNTLSARRLHQASKSAGMALVERLSFLETDLQLVAANLPLKSNDALHLLPLDLAKRLDDRFRNLVILADDQHVLTSMFVLGSPLPRMKSEERLHIMAGKTLVTTSRNMNDKVAVFIAKLIHPADPRRGILMAEINPEYLWGGDGFISPSTDLCVLGQAKELLFTSMAERIPPAELKEAFRRDMSTGQFEWLHDGNRYVASFWTIFMRPTFFNSWVLVQSEKKDDVMEPLQSFAKTFFLVVLLTFCVVILASFHQIGRNMTPIKLLKDATQRINAGDLSHRVRIEGDNEFAELGNSFNEMTESMENHVGVMHTVNSIGVSLSAEKDEAKLLNIILSGAMTVFNADGALLFLVSGDDHLQLSMAHISSIGLWLDGSAAVALHDQGGVRGLDTGAIWASTGAMERTISATDVYASKDSSLIAQIEFDRRVRYRSQSFLSIPLKNHESDVIGILQLINKRARDSGQITPFLEEDGRLAESLASQAAIALTKNRLVQDFKGLFEGLTELISQAIDEKSPYTGGHVRRVADLAMMVADAAAKSASDRPRDFVLSEDERYELKIAALLHDCGKIATPIHIQDKATKLETIWDRINLIKTRAEILRRDRRIALLENAIQRLPQGKGVNLVSSVGGPSADYDQQLKEDLDFLCKCNKGREYMPEEQRERIREIARKYTWVNVRRNEESLIAEDELCHLTISLGTLSPEERQTINNHVVSTINMLTKLPYPKKLRNIPKYAGAHHEHMDGTGYPLRLTRDEIPLAGRIIGIADIFEALTAGDRPYKKAKNLPEAMRILHEMAHQGHIDPDLYDLFVSQKIHLRYADKYLNVGRCAKEAGKPT
jgi:HD-GYP domain-containing protein (c-di-GMP phosphodiesterase class II)/HAMP domain-containing protein